MSKVFIKPKSTLHFLLGKDEKTGKRVTFPAGKVQEVDSVDIANVDKKDYDVLTAEQVKAESEKKS